MKFQYNKNHKIGDFMQQNISSLNSYPVLNSYSDTATRNFLFDEKVKKLNNASEDHYISGLECHMVFQDEFAKNFLEDYLTNSTKPEEKLNHLATAMCIELYAINIFKDMLNRNLKWLNTFTKLLNSQFTSKISSHSLIYSSASLETTEGIAFYFHYIELLMKKRLPSIEEMDELKSLAENAENEEVRKCAEWVISFVKQNIEFNEFRKSSKVAGPLIVYINKTLKSYPNFRTNCFGISQFRTNIINQMNEYYLDDLRNSRKEIIDTSDTLVTKMSITAQEINNRETTFKRQGELYAQIIDKIATIRNSAKNRLEFMKKYEILEFEASSVLPFSRKEYQKYMQETFQSQFPKIDPIAKPDILTKDIRPIKKGSQKKKVIPNHQSKKTQRPATFKRLEHDQTRDQMKQEADSTKATPPAKVDVISTTEMKQMKQIFQYANRVKEWFDDEPFHLKSESYQHLGLVEKFKQKVYHGFSLRVEEFIYDYSFKAEWDNSKTQHKDTLFCIPGEIQFKYEIERGLFTFCQDLNGIVYHRHFSKKATKELLEYANPAFRKVDFPSLEQSMLIEKSGQFNPISMPDDREDLVERQNITDLLRITDRRHDVQLVLFKAQK